VWSRFCQSACQREFGFSGRTIAKHMSANSTNNGSCISFSISSVLFTELSRFIRIFLKCGLWSMVFSLLLSSRQDKMCSLKTSSSSSTSAEGWTGWPWDLSRSGLQSGLCILKQSTEQYKQKHLGHLYFRLASLHTWHKSEAVIFITCKKLTTTVNMQEYNTGISYLNDICSDKSNQ